MHIKIKLNLDHKAMKNAVFVRKTVVFLLVLSFLASCKSNKAVLGGEIDENMASKAVVRNHYANELNFKTLSGRMKIDYSADADASQSINVTLRIEKDKAIWLSAPLGIVKAYITPTRVTFYNKLDNEYFDGDFSYLSNLLGTELDFEKVQNVLLGQAIFDLRDEKFQMEVSENTYQLKPLKFNDLFKALYQIEPKHFKMAGLVLAQPLKNRVLEIQYKNYQGMANRLTPGEIEINTTNGDSKSNIAIEYRNIEFNKPLTFPYSIPKGFKEINLK